MLTPIERPPFVFQVISRAALLVGVGLAVTSCDERQAFYRCDGSVGTRTPLRVPPELRKGTAPVEQASAWAKAVLMGGGRLVTQKRELTPGGKRALFISDTSNAGTGGNWYLVFDQSPSGLRYLGEIGFGAFRAAGPDASGRPRLVTYWHMSASEGELGLWRLCDGGFERVKSVSIRPDGSGISEGNRIYDAFFGPSPVTEAMIQRTFGAAAIPAPK